MTATSWFARLSRRLQRCAPVLLGSALCAGCPAPGEGKKAEAGYRSAAPLLEALSRYRGEHGRYPDALAQLPGGYVPATEAPALSYQRQGEHFVLTFSYSGPGMNRCTYRSDSAATNARSAWRCSGYY